MSCIPKILALKGDKEFLQVPSKNRGIVVESGGNYKGYNFLITFNDMGFRCGYVALSPDHPANNFKGDNPDYNVHGGVTFFGENHLSELFFGESACNDKWIGFDAGHCMDIPDVKAMEKYFPDCRKDRKDHVIAMNKLQSGLNDTELRTFEYITQECHSLIDQLIAENK